MPLGLVPGLSFLLGVCAPAPAVAQPRDPVELEWTAPPECPRVEAVRTRLRKLAGPLKSNAPTLRAEVTITHNDDGGLHLRLLIRSGSLAGERNMEGKSCTALAGAAAVTLVLLLHSSEPLTQDDLAGSPEAVANGSKATTVAGNAATAATSNEATGNAISDHPVNEEPKRAAQTAPATAEQQHPPAAPEGARQSNRRWHVLLQAPQVELGFGPFHQPSLGFAIAAGVSFDRFRFLAKGSLWLSQHSSASNADQQYGAESERKTLTLLACRAITQSWFELSPCLSLAMQHLDARGTGAHVGPQTGTSTWFAVGGGAQGRAHVAPWLSLLLGVDAQLQLSQPLLSVDEIGPVERLLPAAITTTLGSEWIF